MNNRAYNHREFHDNADLVVIVTNTTDDNDGYRSPLPTPKEPVNSIECGDVTPSLEYTS
jgi:hypothetical protein